MHNWHYIPDKPISLTLAADSRLSSTDYLNDHIWELKLGNSDPSAISLETTFGLRARLCRIFPRFIFGDQIVSDPAEFTHPVTIHHYYPNFIEFSFKPFSTVNVKIQYWVPDSHAIAGRIWIANTSHSECPIQLEWSELLLPTTDGFRMSINEIAMTTLLTGKTSDLFPLLFLTGGAQAGKSPYPSLSLSFIIPSHGETTARWVHATLSETNSSYEYAKSILSKNWDAEFARINRINSRGIEVHTGNKEWDTAFSLSQTLAYQLIVNPMQSGCYPSFVYIRKPDQGYSLRDDGSDYNYLWNGQTPLDTYYLTNFLLPSSPELLRGFIENFIESQNQLGEIDLKPGLCGQRSHLLATPVIADLSLRLYEATGDIEFLSAVLPSLNSFFHSWFLPSHDHDGDQIPEYDHERQAGFDDSLLFSQNHSESHGIDISSIESPSLCSFLYRECEGLINISKIVNHREMINELLTYQDKLKSMIDQAWSDQQACYLNRDRDSHISSSGEHLGTLTGSGVIDINREFELSVRPVIRIESTSDITHPCTIFIHGTGSTGTHRVENLPANRIHWQHNHAYVTSEYTYKALERIEITGMRPDDFATARTLHLNYLDQSLLLPLWAGIPTKQRAKILVNLTILNKKKFLGPFGLRPYVNTNGSDTMDTDHYGNSLPWTALILEGMVNYNGRNKAAEIFSRLMKPVVRSLQSDMSLHQSYQSETGKPLSLQNSVSSLVPINLFLDIAGISIINPFHVEISDNNPFPWPITVKYRGLTVIKHEKKTLIIFPDGYNTTLTNDKLQIIKREKSF